MQASRRRLSSSLWQQQRVLERVYRNMEFRGLVPCLANWRKERLVVKRAPAKGLFSLALTLGLACLTCPHARGDVGIVLNESWIRAWTESQVRDTALCIFREFVRSRPCD